MMQLANVPYYPPHIRITNTRPLGDVLREPHIQFYDPNALDYGNAQIPILPGNGNVTLGAQMVAYDGQAMWNRHATAKVGPVRAFFRTMMQRDSRLQHT